MRDRFYSTADLARVCGVSISTIKRWTDCGLLRCVRTPGGHRKFRVQDVAEATRKLGLGLADPESRPGARLDELALLLLQGNTAALAGQVARALVAGDAGATRSLLLDLHRHGMRPADLAQLLHGAVRALALQAGDGSLDDFQLRRAEQLAAGTARALLEQTPPARPGASTALVASVPGVRDPLTVPLAALALSDLGWRSVDLGAELTAAILRGGIATEHPELVVLVHGATPVPLDALQEAAATQGVEVLLLDASLEGTLQSLRERTAAHEPRLTASIA